MLIVNANNLGFIHWRRNSVQYSSDSLITFEGYKIENILDLKDSTLNRINQDTILQNLVNGRKENEILILWTMETGGIELARQIQYLTRPKALNLPVPEL